MVKKMNPFFEKSAKDKDPKGGPKEGSKAEEAQDAKEAGMKRGGKVKKYAAGGQVR